MEKQNNRLPMIETFNGYTIGEIETAMKAAKEGGYLSLVVEVAKLKRTLEIMMEEKFNLMEIRDKYIALLEQNLKAR